MWTGPASFNELGTTVPKNGGVQEYLRHCYGDAYGSHFACTWIFAVKPCAMASISLVFAEQLSRAMLPDANISVWVLKGTAIVEITRMTALNCLGTRSGVRTGNVFMGVKILGLSSIALIGISYQMRDPVSSKLDWGPTREAWLSIIHTCLGFPSRNNRPSLGLTRRISSMHYSVLHLPMADGKV